MKSSKHGQEITINKKSLDNLLKNIIIIRATTQNGLTFWRKKHFASSVIIERRIFQKKIYKKKFQQNYKRAILIFIVLLKNTQTQNTN